MDERKLDHEMLESAKINFENIERVHPLLKLDPLWIIAKSQLDRGLGYPSTGLDGKVDRLSDE
jgi:hypothetical protein